MTAQGGKRPGAGRPRGTTKPGAKRTSIALRIDSEARLVIERRARAMGQTLSEWVLDAINARLSSAS